MEFEASRATCKDANMELVELETKEEYDAVLQILEDNKDSLGSYHYLGAQASDLKEWKWINGGKFAYEMQLEAFDSDEEDASCVQYSKGSSKYFTYRCTDSVPQVICEKDNKQVSSPSAEATPIKPKYSYPASVYLLILATVFSLVGLWQITYYCCC
jgi:hypothetical protein